MWAELMNGQSSRIVVPRTLSIMKSPTPKLQLPTCTKHSWMAQTLTCPLCCRAGSSPGHLHPHVALRLVLSIGQTQEDLLVAFADRHPMKLAPVWLPVTVHRLADERRLGEGTAGRIGTGTGTWTHIGRDRILGQDHHGGVDPSHTLLGRILDHLAPAGAVEEQFTGDGIPRQGVGAEAGRGEVRATVAMIATAIVVGVRAGIGEDAEDAERHWVLGICWHT